jgi:PKD repeat protein
MHKLRLVLLCALALQMALLAACGGSGGLSMGSLGHREPSAFSASLMPAGNRQAQPLTVKVVKQQDQLLLQVSSDKSMDLDGLLIAVNYDPAHYTPTVAQATGAYAPLDKSLTLEMLQEPGTLEYGQVPTDKRGGRVESGAVLLEVLFNEHTFSAPKSVKSVPSNADSVSPLLWDEASSSLKWYYVNPGDYDQNGTVGLSDILPLGMHYLATGPFAYDTALNVIDTVKDGQITITDLTAIGMHYGTHVDYYNVYFSSTIDQVPQNYSAPSTIAPLATVPFSAAQGDHMLDRLYFMYEIGAGQPAGYYWVRPVADDQEGAASEGTRSNLNTGSSDDNFPPNDTGGSFNVPPVADLQLQIQSSKVPASILLDASGSTDSDGTIISYEWDFDGDGLYDAWSTTAQALHVYNEPGTISPRVRVIDNGGASATFSAPPFLITFDIVTNIPPTADIAATAVAGPAPLTVGLLATGSRDIDGTIAKYEWDFGSDGTYDLDSGTDPTVLHMFAAPGHYDVTVRVTDDKGDTATDSLGITVTMPPTNQLPTAAIVVDAANGLAPLAVSFDASTSADPDGTLTDYAWDWEGNGGYDENGASATLSHAFTSPGVYEVRLRVTDNSGAQATAQVTITVNVLNNMLPVADLQALTQSGTAPLAVAFDAGASADPDGTIARFDYDFDGDGIWDAYDSPSTASHTYSLPGTFTARLRVTDNSGAQALATREIQVNALNNQPPQAVLDATPVTGAAPLEVEFDATGSSDPDGSVVRYDYDFNGDGIWDAYDASSAVTFTYSNPGSFNAKLRVTDNAGAQAAATVPVTVNAVDNAAPTAMLSADFTSGNAPLHVTFNATGSSDSDGSIVRFDYDFNGDGIWDAYDGPSTIGWTYLSAGMFTVTLRVTDNAGAQDTATQDIEVNAVGNAAPDAQLSATPDNGDAPLSVSLDATASSDSDGSIVRYDWDFDGDNVWDAYDGPSSLSHTYTAAGNYSAKVRVTDNAGSQSSATVTIVVNAAANAAPSADLQATPDNGNAPLAVSFDATGSSDSDGSIVRYDYDFNNDGAWDAYDGPGTISHAYTTAGVQTAKLRVTDNQGAQATMTVDITVNVPGNANPLADLQATPVSGNAPLAVSFDATGSSDSDGTVARYDYDFNNDGIWDAYDSPATLSYSYATAGVHTAKLRVTDNAGGQDLATIDITVSVVGNATPTADLQATPSSGAAPLTVSFNASASSDSDGTIVRYDYDFNSDNIWDAYDAPATISWTYNSGGNPTAKVRVTDNDGAQAVDTVAIAVTGGGGGGPTASFTATPQNFSSIPQNVVLDPSGSTQGAAPISRYDWDLNNDGFFDMYSGSPVNITRNISAFGVYTYKLRVTDTNGNYSEQTKTVTASGPPVANLVTSPVNPVGTGVTITLNASASYDAGGTITKYEFDRDGNGSYEYDGLTNPITTTSFGAAGDYTVRVRETDNDNNQSIATALVQVRVADLHTIDSGNQAGRYASIAIIGGRPAMVWKRGSTNDVVYSRANDATGATWGAPVIVAASGNVGNYSDLVEANGRPAVTYVDGNSDLFYLRAEDATGSAWVQSNAITLDSGSAYAASLAIIGGNPAVAYGESTLNGIKFRRATNSSGTAWAAATTVNSGGTNGGSDCSLAEVNGMPAVAYFFWTANAGVAYRQATNVAGTAWGGQINISTDPVVNNSAISPSLAVVNGNPAISFKLRSDNSLRFIRASDANGGAWGGIVAVATGGNFANANMLAYINGLPYIAFHDETNDTLRLVAGSNANGSAWAASNLIDSGPDGAGGYIDMVAVNNHPGIAYDGYILATNTDLAKYAYVY